MTTQLGADWQPRARRLADTLVERGDIHDPAWADAVAAVPRHVFTPEVYEQDGYGHWHPLDATTSRGLDRVYSPRTLITTLADRGTHHEGISSSTKPDLMTRMLDTLDIHDGHTVLEIGTGTGYNAALLAHRLGDHRVFSVDLDTELIDPARERLASIGLRPTLITRDGAEGLREHAPFDRIIATCSVPVVPRAWCEQLTDGGLLLADIKTGTSAGNLALLRRNGDRLEGRFTNRWAAFMPIRHHQEPAPVCLPPADAQPATRMTTTPPNPWEQNRIVWFLAHLTGLPHRTWFGMRFDPDAKEPTAGTITAPDGSHASVILEPAPGGTWSVTESGPTPLWNAVEEAHRLWLDADQPDWTRLGITITTDEQHIWIDTPNSRHRWTLS